MTRSPIKAGWTDRLAFEIALKLEGSGEPIETILKAHDISPMQLTKFSKDPVFDSKVRAYRDEIQTKGLTFKLKAKAQAEELLTTSWALIHSIDVSPAVKADLIKSTVKWAGYEPKGDDVQVANSGGVKIVINLGGEATPVTLVDVTPKEITDGHHHD